VTPVTPRVLESVVAPVTVSVFERLVFPVTASVLARATFELTVAAPTTTRWLVGVMVRFADAVIDPLPIAVLNVALPTSTVVAFAKTFAPTATTVWLAVTIPAKNPVGVTLDVDVELTMLTIRVFAKTVLLPSAVKNRSDVSSEALSVLPTNTPLLFATTLPIAPVPAI
jgi:hypothetical protein